MRSEKELLDVADVSVHSSRARERVRSNGLLRDSMHVAQPLPEPWYKRLIPSPEVLTVNNSKQVSGFVVPHWAAGVLLAAMVSAGAFLYNRIDSQRDMLIRLDTQLQERDKHELEYREEFKTKVNVQTLQIENMSSELRAIRAVLTPQQLKAIQRTPKSEN